MAERINQAASNERVLMVHNFYQVGGGEHTVFKNEVKLLRNHGHEVIEYTRSNDELKRNKLKLLLSPFSTLWSFKTYREVRKIIREHDIDIVHCHNTFPLISPSVYYAARSRKIPVIQTIHNFRYLCPNGTFFRDGHVCELCREKGTYKDAIKHKCYRNSKIQTLVVVTMLKLHRALGTYKKINYIFLTDFNKEKFKDFIDINGSNVFVKPNFVNEERNVDRKIANKTFVFAGRLEENKGLKLLIERWKSLPSDYILHIYGDGNLGAYVVEAAGGHSNIIYYGFKPQEKIFDDLCKSAALVFPSVWYEGYPMIIAESLALGCPVITTNIGNQADIIQRSGGGVIFNLDIKKSFMDALNLIIEENERLSQNAKAYYQSILNKDNNYEALEAIYNRAENQGCTVKYK